jgi:hypothetical protein
MYIKLLDTIVNLDLIRDITKVKACLTTEIAWEMWGNDIKHLSDYDMTTKKELEWLEMSTTGTEGQRDFVVLYYFEILYIGREKKRVIVGDTRHEANRVREELATLLNDNKPIMHVIK